jgi:exoribonuclease R
VSLSRYLAGLPTTGPHQRIARAIARQAIMVNVRSVFRATPGPHHGIGADVYARFSAPMREAVGIFLHKEAWEKITGRSGGSDDAALRERIIAGANEAKLRQRALTRAANLAVLDEVFSRDMQAAPARRPRRTGTLMGVTRAKLHVQLDDPPLDVKVYARHLPEPWVADDGPATARCGARVIRLGDIVGLTVAGRDDRGRWRLALAPDGAADLAAER